MVSRHTGHSRMLATSADLARLSSSILGPLSSWAETLGPSLKKNLHLCAIIHLLVLGFILKLSLCFLTVSLVISKFLDS